MCRGVSKPSRLGGSPADAPAVPPKSPFPGGRSRHVPWRPERSEREARPSAPSPTSARRREPFPHRRRAAAQRPPAVVDRAERAGRQTQPAAVGWLPITANAEPPRHERKRAAPRREDTASSLCRREGHTEVVPAERTREALVPARIAPSRSRRCNEATRTRRCGRPTRRRGRAADVACRAGGRNDGAFAAGLRCEAAGRCVVPDRWCIVGSLRSPSAAPLGRGLNPRPSRRPVCLVEARDLPSSLRMKSTAERRGRPAAPRFFFFFFTCDGALLWTN